MKHNRGYTALEALVVLVVIAAVAVGGYLVYNHSHKNASTTKENQSNTASSTPPTNSAYATLSPATVASKTAECNQSIAYASNGVPGPVQCANGELNVTDWDALAALEPKVLSLGYSASASSVQSALCSDVQANISNPIEQTVYQIASLYYGWNFSPSPAVVIQNGTCQNVDD